MSTATEHPAEIQPVAMTWNHWDTLAKLVLDSTPGDVAPNSPFHALVRISSKERADLREIAAFIRSAVSGKRMYDPKTQTAVERGVINRVLKVLGKVRNYAHPLRGLDEKVKSAFDALNSYASPSAPSSVERPGNFMTLDWTVAMVKSEDFVNDLQWLNQTAALSDLQTIERRVAILNRWLAPPKGGR